MHEDFFWLSLEYRLCHEFAGMPSRYLRSLWCDGITPQFYLLDNEVPKITGRAWICPGQRQEEWDFTLFLPHPYESRETIDWAALLPPGNVTCWIALDPHRKILQIEPAAAVPNLL